MADRYDVTVFKPYPFEIGQKIRVAEGKRYGDWEVVGLSDAKVTLKCPISQKEFQWARFCYHVEDRQNTIWPQTDESGG